MKVGIGIGLTILACIAAFGTWGHVAQFVGIIALGFSSILADMKGTMC